MAGTVTWSSTVRYILFVKSPGCKMERQSEFRIRPESGAAREWQKLGSAFSPASAHVRMTAIGRSTGGQGQSLRCHVLGESWGASMSCRL